jgi:hypothetical protein
MIDSDKREIRLLQEMYLPDGDLHSDGPGRLRRFRWANVDDESEQNAHKDSDGEEEAVEEEEAERERKWRMERHEREKFLAEQVCMHPLICFIDLTMLRAEWSS